MNHYQPTSQTKHRPQGQTARQFIPHSCQPIKNNLQWAGVMIDNKDLSKSTSDKPSRIMAFFMPEICLASQAGHNDSITPLTQITGLNRHIMADLPADYGGVTLQNRKANRRICRAVSSRTESEPRHPLPVLAVYRVVTTQNLLGGNNHA